MSNLENETLPIGDELVRALEKADVLNEEHDDVIDELNENQVEVKNWLTLIFKTIKEVFL